MKKTLGSALVLLLVLLAAACAGDDGGRENDDTTTTTTAAVDTTTTTTAAVDTTTATAPGGGPTTTTVADDGGGGNPEAAERNVRAFCDSVDAVAQVAWIDEEVVRTAYDDLVSRAEQLADDPLVQGDPDLAEQANDCIEEFEAIELG